jgi:hypothetical protein
MNLNHILKNASNFRNCRKNVRQMGCSSLNAVPKGHKTFETLMGLGHLL